MNSITLHDLDSSLWELVKAKAKKDGQSLNKTIKNLLEQSLGIRPGKKGLYKEDFEKFCGAWSKAEAEEFDRSMEEFEKIDKKDWK